MPYTNIEARRKNQREWIARKRARAKEQAKTNDFIEKNTPFQMCDFNDECDKCGNPNHKQSWVKMSGFPEEADYYICEECILKDIEKYKDMI